MVTHEPEIAAYAKRQIVIRDGVISSDSAQVEKGKTRCRIWNLPFHPSAHKMRSFLTMIGIIIGVSSVVVIMALGDSMSRQVNKNMTKSQKDIHVFFSPIKSKDGSFTQKQSALTVSGERRGCSCWTTKPLESWVKEAAKLKGVDSYYVTNSTNVTLIL